MTWPIAVRPEFTVVRRRPMGVPRRSLNMPHGPLYRSAILSVFDVASPSPLTWSF